VWRVGVNTKGLDEGAAGVAADVCYEWP
jgi:hypothetical protein